MRKVSLYVDITSMWAASMRTYHATVDYRKLKAFAEQYGQVSELRAFGLFKNTQSGFLGMLQSAGYDAKFNKIADSVEVQLALAAIESKADLVILGVSSRNYAPLIEQLHARGKETAILAITPSSHLKSTYSFTIDRSMLTTPRQPHE